MDFHCPNCGSDELWGDGWGDLGEKIVRCADCEGRWLRDTGVRVYQAPAIDTSTPEREGDDAPDGSRVDQHGRPIEVVQPRPRTETIRDVWLLQDACLRLLVPELAKGRMAVGARADAIALDLGHHSAGRLIAAAHRCVRAGYRSDPHLKNWRLDLRNWYGHASPRSDLYRSPSETAVFRLWQQERLAYSLTELCDDDLWVPLRFIGVQEHASSEQALPQAPRGYWDGLLLLPPGRPSSVPLSQSGGYHPGSVPAEEHWPGRR